MLGGIGVHFKLLSENKVNDDTIQIDGKSVFGHGVISRLVTAFPQRYLAFTNTNYEKPLCYVWFSLFTAFRCS